MGHRLPVDLDPFMFGPFNCHSAGRAGGSAQLSNDDVRPFVIDDIAIAIVIDVIDVIAASAITSDGIVLADIVAAAGRESGDSARSRAGS